MTKISTFDGQGFWNGSFAHGRARLLQLVGVPRERAAGLVDLTYLQLPEDIRFSIETGNIKRSDLI